MSSAATIDPLGVVGPGSFPASRPTTLVVGLGNPILADDGVGWRVVDALEARLAADADRTTAGRIELDRAAVGGLALMERLVGYERAILADAILDGTPVGTVSARPLGRVVTGQAGHLDSAHDASLVEALTAGRALGAPLPTAIDVVGVAVAEVDVFGDRLSPAVAAAVDPAVEAILALLDGGAVGAP